MWQRLDASISPQSAVSSSCPGKGSWQCPPSGCGDLLSSSPFPHEASRWRARQPGSSHLQMKPEPPGGSPAPTSFCPGSQPPSQPPFQMRWPRELVAPHGSFSWLGVGGLKGSASPAAAGHTAHPPPPPNVSLSPARAEFTAIRRVTPRLRSSLPLRFPLQAASAL